MWKLIKENPWKFFLGSFSAVFLTVVGMVYSDYSFLDKATAEKYKADTAMVISDLQKKVSDLTDQVMEKVK